MLEDDIYKEYSSALKNHNKKKVHFLSYVRAELKNQAINLKKDKLNDDEALAVIKKLYKKLIEAKGTIKKSKNAQTIEDLDFEIEILRKYLPPPLSEEELILIVKETIKNIGASSMKDMGKVMKEVLSKVGIRCEAKLVSEIVKKNLSAFAKKPGDLVDDAK